MIRSFTWMDGTLVPALATGAQPPPSGGWVWVDVSNESPDGIREVCRAHGVDDVFINETLTMGSLPMIEEQRDLIYVVLNDFPTASGERLGVSEVDLFLGPDYLISIHNGGIASTDMVRDRIEQGVELAVPTPAGLLAHLAMAGSRRLHGVIDRLEGQLESLEELAMKADPRAITEVHALRRDVIVMRRVLMPQRQIFEVLAEGGHHLIDARSRRAFERVADYQSQLLEALDASRSLLGSVLETHRGAVAAQTNEIVRVLTVFSAIMLPLTLLSGIYGMNFAEIPLADHPWGFWILLAVIIAGGVGLWMYFGRRGFVGAPRLDELPKAVGVGLYQVGTAPIRVLTEGIETTIRMVRSGEEHKPED